MSRERIFLGLHGFGGAPSDWDAVAGRLAALLPGWRFIFPALPGHAGRMALPRNRIEDLACWAAERVGEIRPDVVAGYSLGGRVALACATHLPTPVPKLVLLSASPGLRCAEERALRVEADRAWAERIRACCCVGDWERFWLDWWGQSVFAGFDRRVSKAALRIRAERSSAVLADILVEASPGANPEVGTGLTAYAGRMLYLAGGRDAKYVALAEAYRRLGRHVETACIEGAGHALLEDTPGDVAEKIAAFASDG